MMPDYGAGGRVLSALRFGPRLAAICLVKGFHQVAPISEQLRPWQVGIGLDRPSQVDPRPEPSVRNPVDDLLEESADRHWVDIDIVKRVPGGTLPTKFRAVFVLTVRLNAHPSLGEVAQIVFSHRVILRDEASEIGTSALHTLGPEYHDLGAVGVQHG